MKSLSSTQSNQGARMIAPYKAPVLTSIALFLILLIAIRVGGALQGSGKLATGLKHICGPDVRFKIKRKRNRKKIFRQVEEVAVRPSPGQPLDSDKVIEHLERTFHGYRFKKTQDKRGGYDVFQASRKI